MLFLLLVSSQKCYSKSKQRRPQDCWLCHAGRLSMVAIGNETAGSKTPCFSQKETHFISTSTARLGASTTPETHPADMPLVRKSLEGRDLSESATSLILQNCPSKGVYYRRILFVVTFHIALPRSSTGFIFLWFKNLPGRHSDQAPVVQTLDSGIHKIKIYPVDNGIGFPNTYPLDSDLSGG